MARQDDHRYAVDIRVFISVIVIAMAVSFGVGVGLGPTAQTPVVPVVSQQQAQQKQQSSLPPVTSVEINEVDSALAAKAAADNGELHEPAGQVRLLYGGNLLLLSFLYLKSITDVQFFLSVLFLPIM
mmetsp:Transcript_29582/g.33910  ORF Transcript_29582/g.33910 Transcript_29582/m.33910 type:complete len:127 (+) Transcript_29582:86-466(+)